MNFFEKEPSKQAESNYSLTLSLRQASLACAGVLLTCLFSFMAGYFLGKKNAAEQFLYKIEQESLADQIYSSMCGLSDKDENPDDAEIMDTSETDAETTDSEQESKAAEVTSIQNIEQPTMVSSNESQEPKFYAQLAGFGSLAAAEKFAQRLEKRGYAAEVVERKSRSAKGKMVSWYQVVTKKFENKADLLKLVQSIKKIEHLSGVQIATA